MSATLAAEVHAAVSLPLVGGHLLPVYTCLPPSRSRSPVSEVLSPVLAASPAPPNGKSGAEKLDSALPARGRPQPAQPTAALQPVGRRSCQAIIVRESPS